MDKKELKEKIINFFIESEVYIETDGCYKEGDDFVLVDGIFDIDSLADDILKWFKNGI